MLIKFNKEVATANYNMKKTKYFPRGYRIFKMASDYNLQNIFLEVTEFSYDCCTCSSHPLTEFLGVQQYITIALQTAHT